MNIAFANRIKARILADPRSLWMDKWMLDLTQDRKRREEHEGHLQERSPLACGTVGCIAGHCAFEKYGREALTVDRPKHIETEAAELLGISPTEAKLLFMFNFRDILPGVSFWKDKWAPYGDPYAALRDRLKMETPGTPDYAQVCADAIDLCIVRHLNGEAIQ